MYKVINPLEYGILIEPLFGPVLEGIFKHKYWDFYVKEIDMDGNVMSLTDISCPNSVKANNFEADFTNIHTELKKNIDEFSKSKSNSLVIPAQSMNIENEQLIHSYINKFYTNIRFKSKKSSNILLTRRKPSSKVHRKIIDTWPSHISNFTSFILFKENLSTTDALRILAKKVNVHFSQFSVCGMKDKRSISVQKVCVIKVDPFQLYRSFYPSDIIIKENTDLLIGNINLCCNRLRHGELKGNYFEIVIREINIFKENHENIDNILRDLFKKMEPFGFPNFFGKQRFGLGDVSNYLIGKDIILCDWKSAVNGILCERPKMDNSIRGAIQEWKRSGNSSLALQFIENDLNKKMEVNILRKININNNKIDVHCLDRVPYSIQTMYLHAFQSYIWNQILSLRLEKYSTKILVGDLILNKDSSVKIVTVENISQNKCNITDVVHPIPGYNIMYPQNEIKDWYVKILSEYNIEHSTFKHKIKKYTLPGSYRHIFVWPTDLYFETINYSVDAPLIISDKDSLLVPSQLNDDRSMPNNSLHLENSLKMALKLKFSLPASAYATCFLREIFNEKQSIV